MLTKITLVRTALCYLSQSFSTQPSLFPFSILLPCWFFLITLFTISYYFEVSFKTRIYYLYNGFDLRTIEYPTETRNNAEQRPLQLPVTKKKWRLLGPTLRIEKAFCRCNQAYHLMNSSGKEQPRKAENNWKSCQGQMDIFVGPVFQWEHR